MICKAGKEDLSILVELASRPESEMKQTHLFEKLPDHLTYPNMTPKLIEAAKEWWEYRKGSQ